MVTASMGILYAVQPIKSAGHYSDGLPISAEWMIK
jgi:hypothetical protein